MLSHFICASWRDFVYLAKYPSNGKVNRYVPLFPCVYKIWSQTILDFYVLLLTPSHLGQLLKLPGATVCSPVKCSLGCSYNRYSVRSLYKIKVILPFKNPQSPWDAPINSMYLFANFYFVLLCVCVLFCFVFLVFPFGYQNQSVLHSLNAIGLTLQMKHFCHTCQEVWFEWNFNLYTFSDIVNPGSQLAAVIHYPRGAFPWRGGKNCGL